MTGLSLSLPPVSTAGRLARAAVRDHFTDALNRNTVADLELVISELVANSVEHGRGTIQLSVERSIAAIQGSVSDDGDGFAYTPPDFSSHAPRGGWAGDCRRRRHELGHPPRRHASLVRNHPQRESTDRPS